MKVYSTYSVKIKEYNHIFMDTVTIYRRAVDFFIAVTLQEWKDISAISGVLKRQNYIEQITHKTKNRPTVRYDFDRLFYKFPSYLRRAAIAEAIGKVLSYQSNLQNWERQQKGRKPNVPQAGYVYPVMYQKEMYQRTGVYTARVKVFIRNTWDWLDIALRKSDVDYILRHCSGRHACVPTLQKRGKNWSLDFAFEEEISLYNTPIHEQVILAVDLGINNACVCTTMLHDGTVAKRAFLKLSAENDCLQHAVGRIKKAQKTGARHMPRLWARAKGINDDIAVKTAAFILQQAIQNKVTTIVFEHLDVSKKKRGSQKQRLHLWKARYVQSMVTNKAHRNGIRVSHVNAWGTSRLAFDGSGRVERGINGNYSICRFQNGKIYHCDLSASYNIGARYFIREIIKTLPEKARLDAAAKVPQLSKRITCTLSTLISLHAVLTV